MFLMRKQYYIFVKLRLRFILQTSLEHCGQKTWLDFNASVVLIFPAFRGCMQTGPDFLWFINTIKNKWNISEVASLVLTTQIEKVLFCTYKVIFWKKQ